MRDATSRGSAESNAVRGVGFGGFYPVKVFMHPVLTTLCADRIEPQQEEHN